MTRLCGQGHEMVETRDRWRCRVCDRAKSREYQQANRTRRREYRREYFAQNPEKRPRENTRRWRDALRAETFAAYGGECAVCGSTDELELDHPQGGGQAHRDEVTGGKGGTPYYSWLRQNGWPPIVQILCGPHHREKNGAEARARALNAAP